MLALTGGAAVVVTAASAGGYLSTRRPDAALEPWSRVGTYNDPRLNALSYAILAPNPHNRQPWIAEVKGADQLTIWRDKSLNLPETDPFDRQLTIGMGCFLELYRQAVEEQGYGTLITPFPDGEDGPVAQLVLTSGTAPDPLFKQVLDRHTNREAYEPRKPDQSAVKRLAAEATRVLVDDEEVEILQRITVEAMAIEMQTPRTHMESVRLMRLGKSEINAKPDGIAIGGPLKDSLVALGLITREGQADQNSAEFQQTKDLLLGNIAATPSYALITTPQNTRLDQLEAGRRWVRLHLIATSLGLSMQPVSQALQEYKEQRDLYNEVHTLFAGEGATVQMLGRLGYGPKIDASPRWPLETKIRAN